MIQFKTLLQDFIHLEDQRVLHDAEIETYLNDGWVIDTLTILFNADDDPNGHSRYVMLTRRTGGGGGVPDEPSTDEQDTPIIPMTPIGDPARAAFDAARVALVQAQRDYNAARGWTLIGAMERLKAAQEIYLAAARAIELNTGGGGGGGDYAPYAPIERFFASPRDRYADGYRLGRMMRGSDALAGLLRGYVRDRFANAGIQSVSNRPRWFDPYCQFYVWQSSEREDRFMTHRHDDIPF